MRRDGEWLAHPETGRLLKGLLASREAAQLALLSACRKSVDPVVAGLVARLDELERLIGEIKT